MKNDNSIVHGSIADLARNQNQTIAESFIGADAIIIVDTSGSMDTPDSKDNRTRYAVACEELSILQANMPGKIAVIAFSSEPEFCPNGKPTYFGRNTDLAKALKFTKVADTIPDMRFILISDGEPDSEDAAYNVACKYQNRIDVIYVGSETSPRGRSFLAKLSRASGGTIITAEKANHLLESAALLLKS